ncbi:hypothetical protein C5Y97_20850 [Blastopirellula marina]|uniref:Uncharacterized protein n=1 Tax=Blastopirellula marina TaxID=124 RepID=A0A2S8FF89_9BACT|nr:hypothetical protein C5Y98_20840 [Blastopirellula marina]PTL42694.1 hypothetical protein C5Y97_20850 [Blastopirellula marina]
MAESATLAGWAQSFGNAPHPVRNQITEARKIRSQRLKRHRSVDRISLACAAGYEDEKKRAESV